MPRQVQQRMCLVDRARQPRRRQRPATEALGVTVAAALWLAAVVLAWPTPAAADEVSIDVVDFDFLPPTITIQAGDAVVWTLTRATDPHTVTPLEPPDAFPGSKLLYEGDAYRIVFERAGTYVYLCTVHPEVMEGTVVVEAASPPPATLPGATATAPLADSPAPTSASPPPGGDAAGLAPDLLLALALVAAALGALLLVWGRAHRKK